MSILLGLYVITWVILSLYNALLLALATRDAHEKPSLDIGHNTFFPQVRFYAELKVEIEMSCRHILIWMEINGITLIQIKPSGKEAHYSSFEERCCWPGCFSANKSQTSASEHKIGKLNLVRRL